VSRRPDVEKRREVVASLAVRRVPVRQMAKLLAERHLYNPKTMKPWNFATLSRDVVRLEAEWRANAAADIEAHKSRDLAELDELTRQGWSIKDFNLVLRCQERRAKLLALDPPARSEWTGTIKELPAVLVLPPIDEDPEDTPEPVSNGGPAEHSG
jgi:hypothetical protein